MYFKRYPEMLADYLRLVPKVLLLSVWPQFKLYYVTQLDLGLLAGHEDPYEPKVPGLRALYE